MYIHTYIHTYIHIDMYVYTYIHTYIHIDIHKLPRDDSEMTATGGEVEGRSVMAVRVGSIDVCCLFLYQVSHL